MVEYPGREFGAAGVDVGGDAWRPQSVVELRQLLDGAARRRAPGAGVDNGEAIGAATARSAAADGLDGEAGGPVSWARFGVVIPVLAGSSGAGASSVAVAIADAVTADRRCVVLVDADAPVQSGLAQAAALDGPWTRRVTDQVQIRYSWRGRPGFGALLARPESTAAAFMPGMVPSPPDWLPDPPPEPVHVTVADLGHGGWRATGSPIAGAGGWLRAGHPAPRPIVVVRATRPSLRQAERVLARLEPWVDSGAATPVCQLVVVAAKKWPAEIDDTIGSRVSELLDDAVFIPPVPATEIGGITADPTPRRVLDALRPLLASWGVIGLLPGSPAARAHARRRDRHPPG